MKLSGLVLALAVAQLSYADLIPIGPVPLSGAGLGAVNTVLTFTSPANSTDESGCVAAGDGGVLVTGSTACPENGPSGLLAFTGGDEQAQNNVYSASSLGLIDFANLQLIFNASEPGNTAGQGITIENLALTLWDPDGGSILGAFYITEPYVIEDAFQGVGNAGFGFQLDPTQAGDANLLLSFFPNLYIGAAASASDATGGLETLSIRTVAGSGDEIPEPGTTALMLIGGVAGLTIRRWLK